MFKTYNKQWVEFSVSNASYSKYYDKLTMLSLINNIHNLNFSAPAIVSEVCIVLLNTAIFFLIPVSEVYLPEHMFLSAITHLVLQQL